MISRQPIYLDLNILPLGSYDILIGMDSLERHWPLVDCKQKTVSFITEWAKGRNSMELKPIPSYFRLLLAS